MAVDRKSDHVGNHGGGYVDNDGNRRQFTYIDHDPKTSISGLVSTDKDKEAIKSSLSSYKLDIIQRILDVPASLCPIEFYEFTIRGENQLVVTWNETMLRDEGLTLNRLRDLCTLLENKFDSKVV
jgi:hypothetical protein